MSPSVLEELVEFLHHGNTEIRQVAAANLVGYSTAEPQLFKRNQLEPIRDLKLLVKDYTPIATNALTILVNLTDDNEIIKSLIDDDAFLETVLRRVTSPKESTADLLCMLLANLAKSSSITKLLTLKCEIASNLSTSSLAIDQLLDCFVKGASKTYDPNATYDYLSYLFADLSKHESGRSHFLTPRKEGAEATSELVVPLSKLVVFTEHSATIRRRGVANTIKNVCFDVSSHAVLLADEGEPVGDEGQRGIGLLPYILLPLMGSEEYEDADTDGMLDECQLLPPDKEREAQADILVTHLESLLLLSTERSSRERLRAVKVYPIVRELHLQISDEGVREACDRLVQVIMRDEEGEGKEIPRVQELPDDEDEDEQVVDVL